ncbi:hypothetical protein NEUTE1DRAFT_103877 [Neurospora tetrasperma FGSC 2508]|uniref:Uncharacterized protein n=1 Tax=Neurospora tetrasperma (strain FGSC 2508 / ATCC MYA-4615 / P0657) TaxID=510951 RepID=F8MXF9_NEUT8|nr:uncharacterized protein NEUTE1DRAFT_103877 [Neurospora tetrasperma FGSC 2508]EGO54430.1 hypothetical protein NEUTE1DRAFT_103877 [Neurospora tetrasperma FGSC 2508]EGZ68125.1 hypothetical protein NEUTE2DRAFT_75727 [Neurospora tetrasperma FGSC 2509]
MLCRAFDFVAAHFRAWTGFQGTYFHIAGIEGKGSHEDGTVWYQKDLLQSWLGSGSGTTGLGMAFKKATGG